MVFVPAELKVFVSGSYRSALRLAVVASSSRAEPPRTSTRPLGSRVAFISIRGCDIGGPYRHWGVGADRSMISGGAGAGSPPPKIIPRGGVPPPRPGGGGTQKHNRGVPR